MKKRPPVVLTKKQKECVTYPADQPLLIRGIPGSGKTTVLLERAEHLLQHGEKVGAGPKVLFLTYSNLLARYLQQLTMEDGESSIQAVTFHGWGLQLLADLGISSRNGVVAGKDRHDLIKYARNTVCKYRTDLKPPNIPASVKNPSNYQKAMAEVEFLSDEFEWMKALGKDRNRYMNEPRTGRGTGVHVQKQHREWIWEVFETYQSMLRSKSRFDFDDVALFLYENINRIPDSRRPSHILVDEAQDLTVMQLKVISKLPLRSLTIAADKGQSIYRRNFSWAQVGVDIRGRSRSLEKTYRSTRQIVRLANSLQQFDPLVLKHDEEFVPATEPDIDGPIPELYMAPTLEAQVNQVIRWALRLNRDPDFEEDTIAVIVPNRKKCERYADELLSLGVRAQILRTGEEADVMLPGIKLVTFYSAKGLEFDHVAVTSLRDGTMPAKPSRNMSEEDVEEHLATERRKVFVAITRARLTVALFGSHPVSQFVTELSPSLYRCVE